MAILLHSTDKAEVYRELAKELLAKADGIDGTMPCMCGHQRQDHDPAGWNEGWCDGIHPTEIGIEASDPNDCKCEEFRAW